MNADFERAVHAGDTATVIALLEEGVAEVDDRDQHGQTAIMTAARIGHLGVVDELIRRGADLDRTAKYGLSALMLAVINGHEAIALRLVEAGADVTLKGSGAPGFAGFTAADLAAKRGDESLSERLGRRS